MVDPPLLVVACRGILVLSAALLPSSESPQESLSIDQSSWCYQQISTKQLISRSPKLGKFLMTTLLHSKPTPYLVLRSTKEEHRKLKKFVFVKLEDQIIYSYLKPLSLGLWYPDSCVDCRKLVGKGWV